MKIKINEKLKPYSLQMDGVLIFLPSTSFFFTIHPTLIVLPDGDSIALNLKGPIRNFQVSMEIESQEIHVFGISIKGFFHYKIIKLVDGFDILTVKDSAFSLPFKKAIKKEHERSIHEKISFGSSKSQDIFLMQRRMDLAELLPFIFMLGGAYNKPSFFIKQVPDGYGDLLNLIRSTFKGFFIPSFNPYLGLDCHLNDDKLSLEYLHELKILIKGFLIQEDVNDLFFSSKFYKDFPFGKATDLSFAKGHLRICLQWSKKKLIKVILRAKESVEIKLHFSREVHSFRVRSSFKEIGHQSANVLSLKLSKDDELYLDRFV